jgi:endonuclease/exonuclease/phosphatase (EEP) superfamily protein YafD
MKFSFLIFILSLISFDSTAQIDDKGLGSIWFKILPEKDSLFKKGHSSEKELPSKISALIWNIKKAELKSWKKEFVHFGRGKDLFLVQEAYETDVFISTLNTFEGFEWNLGASFLYRKYGDAATGTMVASQVEPNEVLVKHSQDVEPIAGTPKSATFVKYAIAGKAEELLVISVHGINFETNGAFKRHMCQIKRVIEKHDGPVLLAGDFNTWNNSRSSHINSLTSRLGLVEAPYKNGEARMSFAGHFLDHVFTRGIIVNSAEVVADSVGSDHKPFLLNFLIP